jgi:hypothetical protein
VHLNNTPDDETNHRFAQTSYYTRTPEQDVSLGLSADSGIFKDDKESNFKTLMTKQFGTAAVEPSAVTQSNVGKLTVKAPLHIYTE